jgi:hypothetical protein
MSAAHYAKSRLAAVWSYATLGDVERAWKMMAESGDRSLAFDAFAQLSLSSNACESLLGNTGFAASLSKGLANLRLLPFEPTSSNATDFAAAMVRVALRGEVRPTRIAAFSSALRRQGTAAPTLRRLTVGIVGWTSLVLAAATPLTDRATVAEKYAIRLNRFLDEIAGDLKADETSEQRYRAG